MLNNKINSVLMPDNKHVLPPCEVGQMCAPPKTMSKLTKQNADKINELHQHIESVLNKTITDAIEVGRLLMETKASLKHGEFTDWINKHLVFTDRTARNYMKLFDHRHKLEGASSINDAYKMLAEPKTETVSDLIQEAINTLEQVKDFWENASNFYKLTDVPDVETTNLMFKLELRGHTLIDNFIERGRKELNDQRPKNKQEGITELNNISSLLRKLQNIIGEIMIYKIMAEPIYDGIVSLAKDRLKELELEGKAGIN